MRICLCSWATLYFIISCALSYIMWLSISPQAALGAIHTEWIFAFKTWTQWNKKQEHNVWRHIFLSFNSGTEKEECNGQKMASACLQRKTMENQHSWMQNHVLCEQPLTISNGGPEKMIQTGRILSDIHSISVCLSVSELSISHLQQLCCWSEYQHVG